MSVAVAVRVTSTASVMVEAVEVRAAVGTTEVGAAVVPETDFILHPQAAEEVARS
jgi:hypothetical protein